MAADGTTVIWWSTEQSELIELCDSVLAFDADGRPTGVLKGDELNEERLASGDGNGRVKPETLARMRCDILPRRYGTTKSRPPAGPGASSGRVVVLPHRGGDRDRHHPA